MNALRVMSDIAARVSHDKKPRATGGKRRLGSFSSKVRSAVLKKPCRNIAVSAQHHMSSSQLFYPVSLDCVLSVATVCLKRSYVVS